MSALTATPPVPAHTYRRVIYILAAIFLAAAVLYLLCLPNFQVGAYYDDALYISLAQSLASGQGFRRIELVTAPQTTFVPIGYPFLLTPFVTFFPDTFLPLQLLSLAFTLGALVLLWLWLKPRVRPLLAISVLALTAFAPGIVSFATFVMTEAPFLFFVLLTLVAMDHYDRDQRALTWRAMWVIAAAAMCYFIRVPGVTMVAAVGLYLLWRRQWSRLVVFGIGAGALLGAWFVRNWQVSGNIISSEYVTQGSSSGITGSLSSIAVALSEYFYILPDTLVPIFSPRIMRGLGPLAAPVDFMYSALVWSLVLLGFASTVRRRLSSAEIYVGFLAALLLVWGHAQPRYVLPLLPFSYLYLVTGIAALAARVSFKRGGRTDWIVGASVGLVLVLILARDAQGYLNPLRTRIPDLSVGTEWIRDHAAADAVVMAQTPRSVFIYAKRQTVPFPEPASTFDVDIRYVYPEYPDLSGGPLLDWAIDEYDVDYVLVSPHLATYQVPGRFELDAYVRQVVLPHLARRPERFTLVYENPEQMVQVYQVGE